MSTLNHLIEPALANALGWTLLHSLWQGALIALLLGIALLLLRKAASSLRYWAGVVAMYTLLAGSCLTFHYLYSDSPVISSNSISLDQESAFATPEPPALLSDIRTDAEVVSDHRNHPTELLSYFEPHLPLLVAIWIFGILLLGLKLLGELVYIQHLQHYKCQLLPPFWQEKAKTIALELGIRKPVLLKQTRRIHGPLVVGFLKPAILFPIGLVNQLTTDQVEGILAHELAHIKRNDYLANLLISFVEVLYFFNPTAWWISSKIKAEREHSCDEYAIAYTGDAVGFVKSLAQLEEWRQSGSHPLAMAFTGSGNGVLARVQRILQPSDKKNLSFKAVVAMGLLLFCGVLAAFQQPIEPAEGSKHMGEEGIIVEETPPLPFVQAEEQSVTIIPEEAAPSPNSPPTDEPAIKVERKKRSLFSLFSISRPDTLPEEMEALRKQMAELEQQQHEIELEMRKEEQLLREQAIQLEQEQSEISFAERKAAQELEMEMQKEHHNMEEIEHIFQKKELELQKEELELQKIEQELEMERAQMHNKEGLSAAERQRMLEQIHKKREQALEVATQHRMKALQIEQERREQMLAIEQQQRALEKKHFLQEQKMERIESEIEMRHHKMEQKHEMLRSRFEVRMENLANRMRPIEQKMEELESRMEEMEFEEEGGEQ